MNRRAVLTGGAAMLGLAVYGRNLPAGAGTRPAPQTTHRPAPVSHRQAAIAAAAVRYAREQDGKPYLWGGPADGTPPWPVPDAFDCSGLVYEAYASAGLAIPRTSEEQWAQGTEVTSPREGDLVFFPGGDGTRTAPGHVGLVLDPGRALMIQAYAPGVPIGTYTYGQASSLSGTGPGDVIGFTRPAART